MVTGTRRDKVTMAPRKFVNDVVKLYYEAQKPIRNSRATIIRGRNHSVSSQLEDLFAYYLARNCGEGYVFLAAQGATKVY